MTEKWNDLTVEKQNADPKSTLNLYRTALKLRADHLIDQGPIAWLESPNHGKHSPALLAVRRGDVSVYMNLSDSPIEIELSGKLLIVSAGTVDARDGKMTIPAISTIWIHH
jgi:alpha-glucosidase